MKRFLLAAAGAVVCAMGLGQRAEGATVYAINSGFSNQQIVTFDSASPGNLTSRVFLQGLEANEEIVGIDVRPRDRMIYGIGSHSNLYQINYESGEARLVAALTNQATGQPIVLDGGFFGVDFNPVVDRLRVVSDRGQNLRIVPPGVAGTAAGTTFVDGTLDYTNSAENPSITAVAYANNVDGATTTTLFGIDTLLNQIATASNPNAGQYALGGTLSGPNPTELTGFDIETGTGTAYGAFRPAPGASSSSIYTINLGTGAATLVGMIGRQEEMFVINGITLGPAIAPEPGSLTLAGIGAMALLGRRRRK